jgi:diguanylate cyclase (GGDEF)-like protein
MRRPGLFRVPDETLASAYGALDDGRVDTARDLANTVLAKAREQDLALEAHALACLAHCDRVASRLSRAAESSRRASQLFEQLGDVHGEARALTVLAHTTMLLGRHDEAVEAGLLAVRLCELEPAQPLTVLAHNCLGLAYSWSGDHARADLSLEAAVEAARRCDPPVSVYQPRLNQVWVEASRLLDERYETGAMQSLARMRDLMAQCRELERRGEGAAVLPGLRSMARTISLASSALLAVWEGDASARGAIDAAAASLSAPLTWLDAFVHWCEAELCWARQDWAGAEAALYDVRRLALSVEHEQLASRAHVLLAQVFEIQGKHAQALGEQRALRVRERRVMMDSLGARDALVSWRLGARRSERHLRQALLQSRQFERWSLEDALTGLANRRRFQIELAERVGRTAGGAGAVTVAMVDVDKFKAVNDRFGHLLGDRVLKTLAAVLVSQLREKDLAARWAGDEFTVIFDGIDEAQAWAVCERIRAAVAAFDWESMASGLRMSVSIGLAEAHASDSAEEVVGRSDASMYRAKTVQPGGLPC